MKRIYRMMSVLLAILMLCLSTACQNSTQQEAAGELTAYTSLDDISDHGNVYLKRERRLLLKDLEEAGIKCGDKVKVTFLDQSLEMPVAMNFSAVEAGETLLRVKDEGIELSINMGNFAAEFIADATPTDDGKRTWAYKKAIKGPVEFKIELIEKGEIRDDVSVQMNYTNDRTDYPNLSDEEFANFRMIATTGMGNGALYRTSSPVNPKINRSAYADAALKKAGVHTIINLADSQEQVEKFSGYGNSYYSTARSIALNMEISFYTDDSKRKLAEGLRFLASHEGPYAIHCLEGKDRTGLLAALLECFMGATADEVRKDYMVTFYNFYGIKPGDEAYAEIAENNISVTLRIFFEVDDLDSADLSGAAEKCFRLIGLNDTEIKNLRENLGKSYSANK